MTTEAEIRAALAARPGDPAVWFVAADWHEERGDSRRAEECRERGRFLTLPAAVRELCQGRSDVAGTARDALLDYLDGDETMADGLGRLIAALADENRKMAELIVSLWYRLDDF